MKTRILIEIQEGRVVKAESTSPGIEISYAGYDIETDDIKRGIFPKTPQFLVLTVHTEALEQKEIDDSNLKQTLLWFSNRERNNLPNS